MKKILFAATAALGLTALPVIGQATPEQDRKEFVNFFQDRFPNVPMQEFANGVNAIDEQRRQQWIQSEEFPPYEFAVDEGRSMWENTTFPNGKTYADCFDEPVDNIRTQYPYFDTDRGEVITLELAINECRTSNGAEPLGWKKGDIAKISGFLGYEARGKEIDVEVPNDEAQAWYERGKNHFYAKRGQLNMACADCHQYYSGQKARANVLSPALGHTTHFPVHRKKWGGLGTLHRRYGGCNRNIRAKPLPAQSEEYRALEYFEAYMSNGLEINAPGGRE
mgnify:CR=1 FL=1